jgi:hypothetical protein
MKEAPVTCTTVLAVLLMAPPLAAVLPLNNPPVTISLARLSTVIAPLPLVKLSRFSVTVPAVMVKMVNAAVPAAVLRCRVAPLPSMVRFSATVGRAEVST